MTYKNVNGKRVPQTAEDIVADEKKENAWANRVPDPPSFQEDVINALTGTPAEQTAAKQRLKDRKP